MRRLAAGFVAVAVAAGASGCRAVKEAESDPTTTIAVGPTTTLAPGIPTTSTTEPPLPDPRPDDVELQQIADLSGPTALAARAGDPALYVAEQGGRIRRIEITTTRRRRTGSSTPVTTQTFQVERSAVLDISDDVVAGGEQGLLGLTFSTDGNRLYVAYTGTDERQHLDEFEMGAERPDASSRREILVIDDFASNHNGGQLAFGPDGFLYWGMGDGGGAGDPEETGQDPGDLLGSILRIDPDVPPERRESGPPYAIPDGNPFADGSGAEEVWAYGLRNPWRFSFDRATGDLWIADVGQNEFEEIDYLPAGERGVGAGRGANLGWPVFEGDEPFEGDADPSGLVAPIHVYDHDDGCSVTGGYVYRGRSIPSLVGAYLFADYCEGEVQAIVHRDGEVEDVRSLGLSAPALSSFGEDADGELYVLSLDGPVYRIVPATS